MYDFLREAGKCIIIQPERQYFLEHDKENNIHFLLLKDDPCRVMNIVNETWLLFEHGTFAGYIKAEILEELAKEK